MKRRSFIKGFLGALGLGAAMPAMSAPPAATAAASALDAAFKPLPDDLYEKELSDAFQAGYEEQYPIAMRNFLDRNEAARAAFRRRGLVSSVQR